MVKCITLEYPDGRVAVRGGLNPKFLARFNGDVDAALQHVLDNLVPIQNPDAVARIEDVTFPPDRKFRDAWVRGRGAIDVSMPKARAVHMNRIRVVRDAELVKTDNDLKKAEDNNDNAEAARLRDRRKTLRDIPQTYDLSGAATPDELDALWPRDLPRP